MKFLNSLTAAIAMGLIVLSTSFAIWGAYINIIAEKLEPGDPVGILFLYYAVIIIPLIIIILTIVFRIFYKKLNVPFILFSGVFSLWVFQFVMLFISWSATAYIFIIPIILFPLTYLFIKRKNTWLYINGFTIGTLVGWLLSYGAVILWRKFTNTLTSFFWFDAEQKLLLLITILLGAWIGIYLEKKRKVD